MKAYYHVTPISNYHSIMERGLIPQVGERSKQLDEEPGIFLFPTYEDCETALWQWLGEAYEDLEEELITLEVRLPNNFRLDVTGDWEVCSRYPIEPQYITFFKNEG